MIWKKLDKLHVCSGFHPKLQSHSANPLAIHFNGDIYRIFYSARDSDNRSSVGAVDVDIVAQKIVNELPKPVITHGAKGTFYSHGISIGNTYQADGKTYMLFMGWQQPVGGHWFGEIGRFLVNTDLSLTLDSDAPFLGLDDEDPISLSYPWVEKIGKKYCMWYGSTMTWDAGNSEMVHVIKYAESHDGHKWNKFGGSIPPELGVAQAFSRPTVWVDANNTHHMWYSYRSGNGESYRIGYAKSSDGITWSRYHDQCGLTCSKTGWDSEMIEYPFVFEHRGVLYMLYNGNGFGKSGIGLAVAHISAPSFRKKYDATTY